MNKLDFYKNSWENLKKELKFKFPSEVFYQKFFLNTFMDKEKNNIFYIIVENDFIKEILEKDYKTIIEDSFSDLLNKKIKISFNTKNEIYQEEIIVENKNEDFLNYDMSFDNYVVGDFNKDAYKALKDILKKKDSLIWNPIFIYGTTGVGKTHLLNAIGVKYKMLYSDKKIKYINTEDFLRNAYSSLSTGGMELEKFKNTFNDIDLLLIDDIQFLTNKEKLNEIFFNIFNYFIKNKKYIIIASDRKANEINLDQRMISRFNSGLSIYIPTPDIETIKKIIIQKFEKIEKRNKISSLAINFIANRFNQDIRTLEGVINKILFFSQNHLEEETILNEEVIKKILENEIDNGLISNGYKINPNLIIDSISMAYGVSMQDVKSKQRQKQLTFVRKICMYCLRTKLSLSFSEIGSFFSNRDHSTVIDSVNFIKEKIKSDSDLNDFIENILNKI